MAINTSSVVSNVYAQSYSASSTSTTKTTKQNEATEVKKDEVSDYFPDEEKDYYSDIHSRAKGIFGKIPDPAVLKEEVSQQAKFNNCIIDIVEEFKAALIKEKNRLKKC